MSGTKKIFIDPENIDIGLVHQAAECISRGGLVVIPTDTVYGIAADFSSGEALKRLYQLKQRPQDKPFAVLIGNIESVQRLSGFIPPAGYKLIQEFWPGPLTLVLPAAGKGTIGLRMPDHKVTLAILDSCALPVACPSANISGKPAPLLCSQALGDFEGKVDMAVDSGPAKLGRESSVVDLSSGQGRILREGALTVAQLDPVLSRKDILFVCTGNSCRSVMAKAYLEKLLAQKNRRGIKVLSAGITAVGGGATAATREVLAMEDMDVSSHRAQRVTPEMVRAADLILAMEEIHERRILEIAPDARNRVFLLKEFAKVNGGSADIHDPIGGGTEIYRQTLALIEEAVDKVEKLI